MTEIKTDIDFTQLVADVACIKQAILGNGEPGLCQRVDELEKAQKRQGWISGVCGGFGFVVGGFLEYLISIFRGG